jgi:hypothetical protein
MPEDSISEQIFAKFQEAIKKNELFDGIAGELVSAIKQNDGKIRLKEILRGKTSAYTKP